MGRTMTEVNIEYETGYDADRSVCVVLTTCPDEAVASRLARAFVERGLAACVTRIGGARSVYRWQGRIEEDAEMQLVIKTRHECLEALRALLGELHPYDEPEFLVLDAGGSREYLGWIEEVTEVAE
ncbi:MAG: divalent-cation tolerance protein CutA [Gammaproteobacteria bacterium]|nr:divalent-cation tolerance protein CutA [Gammaproteobacteria bacterium]